MLTETRAHIAFFKKQLSELDKAPKKDDKGSNKSSEIEDIKYHYRAAVRALTAVEAMQKPDDWEGVTLKTIGQSMRFARLNAKMSIKELEKLSGIKANTLYCYENDSVTPSLLNLVSIADALNISLDKLIGRSLPEQPAKED